MVIFWSHLSAFISYLSTLRKEFPFSSYSHILGPTRGFKINPCCHYLAPWPAPWSFACAHNTSGHLLIHRYSRMVEARPSLACPAWKRGHGQQRAHCYWGVLASKPAQWTELGNIWVYIQIHVQFISTSVYKCVKILSLHWYLQF